jgi:hypothetical protein
MRRFPLARLLLVILAALSIAAVLAAEEASWRFDKVPLAGGPDWQRAAAAGWSWELAAGKGGLALRAIAQPATPRYGLAGGLITGGPGGLVWQADGGQAAVTLLAEPVTAIGRAGGEVYALTGTLGAGGSRGGLWLVEAAPVAGQATPGKTSASADPTAPWRVRSIVDLKEPGWAICAAAGASGKRLWVATQSRLYRIDRTARRIDTVVDQAFWAGLRPVSMVEAGGVVHIGMRGGVASVDPVNRVMAWTERLEP